LNFKKWHPSGCASALDFSQEQDFPVSNLIPADLVGEKLVFCGANSSSMDLELGIALRGVDPPEF
jgi:hypothetical protein